MKTLLEQVEAIIPLAEKAGCPPWGLFEDDYETIIFIDREGTGERPFGYEKVATCDNENLCDEGRPGADDAALIVAACNLDFPALAAALRAAASPAPAVAGEAGQWAPIEGSVFIEFRLQYRKQGTAIWNNADGDYASHPEAIEGLKELASIMPNREFRIARVELRKDYDEVVTGKQLTAPTTQQKSQADA